MTPEDLGDLAESLVPVAMQLAGAVRDDVGEVARILKRVPTGAMPGLAVVLAAMVDIDATPTELLSWVTWDAHDRNQPSLFEGAQHDPASWADERCRRLALDYRSAVERSDTAPTVEQRQGYLQWEKRRKRRSRSGNAGVEHVSTGVSSTA